MTWDIRGEIDLSSFAKSQMSGDASVQLQRTRSGVGVGQAATIIGAIGDMI